MSAHASPSETTSVQFTQLQKCTDSLITDWDDIVHSAGLNPTLAPGWTRIVLESHGLLDATMVHSFSASGRTIAVVPVVRLRENLLGLPVRRIGLASNVISYHAEIVALDLPEHVLITLLSGSLGTSWDVAQFSNLPEDGPTARAVRAAADALGIRIAEDPGETSPYIRITQGWDEYLRGQTKRFRANNTRYLKRLRQDAGWRMEWFESVADAGRLLELILQVEDRSWKKKEGIAISDRSAEVRYHELLLPSLARHNQLMANVLFVDARPVAYVLCATGKSWVGQLKTSFDATVTDAGSTVVSASVIRAFERGFGEYDFLGTADKHKLVWTELVRRHVNLTLYNRTPMGGLAFVRRAVGRKVAEFRDRWKQAPKAEASTPSPTR